ncbi:MAG: hypothetical protein FJ090_22755, partial [Deltaproteobacteria bacterium]|nr:hypothetical protein [Deltaproteobacteria bacterium]
MRIRTGGVEIDVADEAELQSLRDRGLLGPDTDVWRDGRWTPLDAPPATPRKPGPRTRSDDPWAAWSGADDEAAAEDALRAYARRGPEPVDLPVSAMSPMARPIVVTERPRELPGEAVAPVDEHAVARAAPLDVTLDRPTPPPTPPRPSSQAAPVAGLPPAPGELGSPPPRRPHPTDTPPATVIDERDTIRLGPQSILGLVLVILLLVGGGWGLY